MTLSWKAATWTWLAVLAVIFVATASDYGNSWDERIRSDAGELKLAYYSHLLAGDFDTARDITPPNDSYPGFHDLSLAVLRRISPLSGHLTGNLFSAFLGFMGIIGTVRLARLMGGAQAGFWAAVFMTLLPAWYGHAFINPKDIPFATGYIWAVGFIYTWLIKGGSPRMPVVLLCGVAIGITMATRVGGVLLLCYLGFFTGLVWLATLVKTASSERKQALHTMAVDIIPRIIFVCLISVALLLLYWPSGQLRPFSSTGQTLESITRFDWPMPVFFEGRFVDAPDLPAYYILKMMLLKVPLIHLLMFGGAAVYWLNSFRKLEGWRDAFSNRIIAQAFVWFSIVFPLAYVIVMDSVLYNGLRHLLFVLPPLCAMAGVIVPMLVECIRESRPPFVRFAYALIGIGLVLPCYNLIRLHPYQYIYYNELAGGVQGAARSYETDYWCTVYRELSDELVDYLKTGKLEFQRPFIVVNTEHVTWLLEPYLQDRGNIPIHVVRSQPQEDDFYLASTSWSADQYYHGEIVRTVESGGIRLGIVKDRRGLNETERQLGYEPGKE